MMGDEGGGGGVAIRSRPAVYYHDIRCVLRIVSAEVLNLLLCTTRRDNLVFKTPIGAKMCLIFFLICARCFVFTLKSFIIFRVRDKKKIRVNMLQF